MSAPLILQDLIKSQPVASIPSSYVIGCDESGAFQRIPYTGLSFLSLANKENAKSHISLKDFLQKYVKGCPVGFLLSDDRHQYAAEWFLDLKNDLSLSMQEYMVMVTKNLRDIDSAWCSISFLLIPIGKSNNFYSVWYTSYSTPDSFDVKILKIPMTAV